MSIYDQNSKEFTTVSPIFDQILTLTCQDQLQVASRASPICQNTLRHHDGLANPPALDDHPLSIK